MKKILSIIVFLSLFSRPLLAERPYSFDQNQKLRVAGTILISQIFSRGLSEFGVDVKNRVILTDIFLIGTALTAEALSPNFSKNNLTSVGIGLVTSNLISITLDW